MLSEIRLGSRGDSFYEYLLYVVILGLVIIGFLISVIGNNTFRL